MVDIGSEEDLEEVIEEKVEERVEGRLDEERERIRKQVKQQLNSSSSISKSEDNKMSRRQFLKMLGLGAGSLAVSSMAAGTNWTKITPRSQGVSEIKAETATNYKGNDIDSDGDGEVDAADIARALDSTEVGGGLSGGDGTALSVDITDIITTGIQDDGSNNLELDESVIKDGGAKEIEAQEFGSGSAEDGFVLTSDGNGGTVWELGGSGISFTDVAKTFTESDVTVETDRTIINNGSIELGDELDERFEDNDKLTDEDTWSDWYTNGAGSHFDFSVTNNGFIEGNYEGYLSINARSGEGVFITRTSGETTQSIEFTVRPEDDNGNSSDGYEIPFVNNNGSQNNTSGNGLGQIRFVNGGGNVRWNGVGSNNTGSEILSSWSTNTNYTFKMEWDFANNQVEIFESGTSRGTFNLINSDSGWDTIGFMPDTNDSNSYAEIYFDDLLVGNGVNNTGSATISWPEPNDVYLWHTATFHRTLDNETVTVDILDESDNVLLSDISHRTDISSINSATNIKIRANISRNDSTNNPTLDSAYRKWSV